MIRARAIENELLHDRPRTDGVATCQGRWVHGRSMIVDPWGTVVTTAADGVGIANATVDPARVEASAAKFHRRRNRRPGAYKWPEESASLAAGRLAF